MICEECGKTLYTLDSDYVAKKQWCGNCGAVYNLNEKHEIIGRDIKATNPTWKAYQKAKKEGWARREQ